MNSFGSEANTALERGLGYLLVLYALVLLITFLIGLSLAPSQKHAT